MFSSLLYAIQYAFLGPEAYTGLIATIIEMLGAMVAIYKFNIKKEK